MGRGRQRSERKVCIPCVGIGVNVPWLVVYSSIVRASESVTVEE